MQSVAFMCSLESSATQASLFDEPGCGPAVFYPEFEHAKNKRHVCDHTEACLSAVEGPGRFCMPMGPVFGEIGGLVFRAKFSRSQKQSAIKYNFKVLQPNPN